MLTDPSLFLPNVSFALFRNCFGRLKNAWSSPYIFVVLNIPILRVLVLNKDMLILQFQDFTYRDTSMTGSKRPLMFSISAVCTLCWSACYTIYISTINGSLCIESRIGTKSLSCSMIKCNNHYIRSIAHASFNQNYYSIKKSINTFWHASALSTELKRNIYHLS